MPATGPQVSKVEARSAILRIPEVRSGVAEMSQSVAGFCNDSASSSYGQVWAMLSTDKGPVHYSGYADEPLQKVRGSTNFSTAIQDKLGQGFQDMDSSTLRMASFAAMGGGDATYRGLKRVTKCSLKRRKSCKKSTICDYRKGVYKSGKRTRSPVCARKSRKSRRKSRSGKKMKRLTRRTSSRKKRRSSSYKKRRSSSGKKMRRVTRRRTRKSRSGKKMRRISKSSCDKNPRTSWVKGKKGSHVGYCRTKPRKSRRKSRKTRKSRKSRSGKKMRRMTSRSGKKKRKSSSAKKMKRKSSSAKKMKRKSSSAKKRKSSGKKKMRRMVR